MDIAIHRGVLPIEEIILSRCALEMSSFKKKRIGLVSLMKNKEPPVDFRNCRKMC